MKDTVFIGWTTDNTIAIKVKKLIDQESFLGVVGGNYIDNPEGFNDGSTINETIVKQMNHCDQAILIFNKPVVKKKDKGPKNVSGNLVYEYGYLNGLFGYGNGQGKILVLTIDFNSKEDELLFPSDLRGAWVNNIETKELEGKGSLEDKIALKIKEMFIANQYKINNINLLTMLDNHHLVEEEMDLHATQPRYSDYDFATYILVYAMSGFCFQEHFDHIKRLGNYKVNDTYSPYIKEAVNYAMHTLKLFCSTSPNYNEEDHQYSFNFTHDVLFEFTKDYKNDSKGVIKRLNLGKEAVLKNIKLDKVTALDNKFDALLIAQLQEHMTYALLLYLFSETDKEQRIDFATRGIAYGLSCIHNLDVLKASKDFKEYAMLLESYEYKNLATFYKEIGEYDKYQEYQDLSLDIRDELRMLDPEAKRLKGTLVEYLNLEYYSQLIEIIDDYKDEKLRKDCLIEINNYIKKCETQNQNRLFMLNMLKEEYEKRMK